MGHNRPLQKWLIGLLTMLGILPLLLFGPWGATARSLAYPAGAQVVPAQPRPTLDPSRQPLTAVPLATIRAGLTATALARTVTSTPPRPTMTASATRVGTPGPTASATRVGTPGPTASATRVARPTMPAITPSIPQVGIAANERDYRMLIVAGLLSCLSGVLLVRKSRRSGG